uniref:Uncharacterized protein n=1 Tax=Venturia canescens TaxID=32260 RepID=A0A0U1ZIW0_9HYME|nr:hypothetical protein [Venturia canescens]
MEGKFVLTSCREQSKFGDFAEDSLCARLNGFNLPSKKASNLLNGVYVGGPSAVGKSTTLNKIRQNYPWARVSDISFETLRRHHDDPEMVTNYLLTRRDAPMIYEYTNECTILYKIVNRFMQRDLNRDNVQKCHRECYNALNEASSHIMFIILDSTKNFKTRYYKRLCNASNTINRDHDKYLILQLAAFLALLGKRHLYPFMSVMVIHEAGRILGEEDTYGLDTLFATYHSDNDYAIATFDCDRLVEFIVDAHISHAEDILELS